CDPILDSFSGAVRGSEAGMGILACGRCRADVRGTCGDSLFVPDIPLPLRMIAPLSRGAMGESADALTIPPDAAGQGKRRAIPSCWRAAARRISISSMHLPLAAGHAGPR